MEIGKSGVDLRYLGHSGFFVNSGKGKIIAIDPCNLYDGIEKADIILITHNHKESCSIKDIERLLRDDGKTYVICPADCQSKILKLKQAHIESVEVGDKIELPANSLKIETFPAYNKYRDDHPKSEGWLGYLISLGNVVIYHAGDTDHIPEMQKLSGYGKHDNNFVALLPVSGKTVMNSEQASDAASIISPDLALPMAYSKKEDAEEFVEFCKEKNIKALVLEKI